MNGLPEAIGGSDRPPSDRPAVRLLRVLKLLLSVILLAIGVWQALAGAL